MNSRSGDAWTRRQLLGAAGAALAAAEPAVAAPLLADLAAALHRDLTQQAQEPAQATCAAASAAALVHALAARAPLVAALLRALAPCLPPYAAHPALVEPMFNILKHTVSALMGDCIPLMDDIGELTVTAFNHHPCAAGLDLCKLVVIICGTGWAGSRELVRVCVERSARVVAASPAAAPDLAEGLFAMVTYIARKRPQHLDWLRDLLPDLIQLAGTVIRSWEAGAARSACACVAVLAQHDVTPVQPHAPDIVASALRCIGGATPRNQIEPLAELLLGLNRAEWRREREREGNEACLALWLRQALATPNFPTAHATDAHKHKFIAAVIKEKSSKRRLLETVQEFSLVCRGLVGTEYARQSIATKQLVAN